jgi:zeaxanthin glucosyltransferase
MPHFAISCPPLPGHVNPFCVLGRELVRRGHKVTLFSVADAEPMMHNQGLRFCPLGEEEAPAGTFMPLLEALKEQQGLRGNLFVIRAAARVIRLILDHGPSALRREGVEAVLADQNEPALASVSEHLRLPFASICTSLPINREPEIPPSFTNWEYSAGVIARLRNRLGYKVSDFLTRNLQNTLNGYREKWGLSLLRSPDDTLSTRAQVAQMPREFDFPRPASDGGLHYTGPWIDDTFENQLSPSDFPYDKLDGRPILYASLGTLQNSNSRYFEIFAEACRDLPTQVVISVGAKPGAPVPKLEGNHLVVPFAPQVELLKRSSLAITHAGMNTTMHALHLGVPLIAIPLTHDQPGIAARLKRTGAGVVLSPGELTGRKLRNAILLMLKEDSSWRLQAKRMQRAAATAGGVVRAADILEQNLLEGKPELH